MKIKIPLSFNKTNFETLNAKWSSSNNVSIEIPSNISKNQAENLIKFLVTYLPNEFAYVVLADLIESINVSNDILESYFDIFDSSVQVVVALKPKINKSLIKKCLSSSNPDVIEHIVFNKLVSISDCEKLLKINNIHEKVIKRAIDLKRP